MNTTKSVYEKLFKNEVTELASHEIELAVVPAEKYKSESDSIYKESTSKAESNKKEFFSKQAALVKPLNELRAQTYREMMDFVNKADALGIEGKSLKQTKDYEKVISDLDKRIQYFNKEYILN